jgi:hypothetical protein
MIWAGPSAAPTRLSSQTTNEPSRAHCGERLVSHASRLTAVRESVTLGVRALGTWTPRQVISAIICSVFFGVLVGVATVLIPNPVFSREIAPVWWNYPVWVITSVITGMLVATYVRPRAGLELPTVEDPTLTREATRSARFGVAGGFLAWFAVGCPVCNKLALLALGYSGALSWFAPLQPVFAIAALLLSGVALVWRLRGQVACPLPPVAMPEETSVTTGC